MKAELMNMFGKVSYSLKKHSPEIMAVAGVVGVVTSVVLACKATTKVDEVLEEHKDKMEEVHKQKDEAVVKKETAMVYAQTGMAFVKLYGPSVTLLTLSLGALVGSNQILRKRNLSLAAAYTAVDQAFKKYRNRVTERFGDEVEKQLYFGTKQEEIEETVTDEKGKTKIIKKTVDVADPNQESMYVKYLTARNTSYSENETYIETYVNGMQHTLTDLLHAKHYLTLNEAYEAFGFDPTPAGFVVGWLHDTKNPTGDNYVQISVKKVRVFGENGYEIAYALDFNVDGNIKELMQKKEKLVRR